MTSTPQKSFSGAPCFIRQKDEFSCGVACLATIAKLYGVDSTNYDALRLLLEPEPIMGTCNFRMAEIAQRFLPVVSHGENTYHKGIAVANIMEDEGHYVVFLYSDGSEVVYYCPYEHKIFRKAFTEISWISESGHLKNWSINFAPSEIKKFTDWQNTVLE